jgi:hypothetical protein
MERTHSGERVAAQCTRCSPERAAAVPGAAWALPGAEGTAAGDDPLACRVAARRPLASDKCTVRHALPSVTTYQVRTLAPPSSDGSGWESTVGQRW